MLSTTRFRQVNAFLIIIIRFVCALCRLCKYGRGMVCRLHHMWFPSKHERIHFEMAFDLVFFLFGFGVWHRHYLAKTGNDLLSGSECAADRFKAHKNNTTRHKRCQRPLKMVCVLGWKCTASTNARRNSYKFPIKILFGLLYFEVILAAEPSQRQRY